MKNCPSCNVEMEDEVTICTNCGWLYTEKENAGEVDNEDAITRMFNAAKNKVQSDLEANEGDEKEEIIEEAEEKPKEEPKKEPPKNVAMDLDSIQARQDEMSEEQIKKLVSGEPIDLPPADFESSLANLNLTEDEQREFGYALSETEITTVEADETELSDDDSEEDDDNLIIDENSDNIKSKKTKKTKKIKKTKKTNKKGKSNDLLSIIINAFKNIYSKIPPLIIKLVLLILIAGVSFIMGYLVQILQVQIMYETEASNAAYTSIKAIELRLPPENDFIAYSAYVKKSSEHTECIIYGAVQGMIGDFTSTYYRVVISADEPTKLSIYKPFDMDEYERLSKGNNEDRVAASLYVSYEEAYQRCVREIRNGKQGWRKPNINYINSKLQKEK